MVELANSLPVAVRPAVVELAGRPGKLLRASLVAACAAFGPGGADPGRTARLGAVVELLHLASLLHDDVIDRADIRRGVPSAHAKFGAERASLAGLACFSLAGMEAAELGAGISRAVAEAAAGLAYGEMLDVERAFDTRLSLDDYLELAQRKTGDLFQLCCVLGAAEARLVPDVARLLARFGTAFGVAFQLLDDCLDLDPDARSGKPDGNDHLLGVFGAPTLCALHRDHTGELAALLMDPALRPEDGPKVRALVIDLGGLAAARSLAEDQLATCESALTELPPGEALEGLAAYLTLLRETTCPTTSPPTS
ncbi:polyprenyl synthetase family protein [Actinomadura harenae]|uniref:Polyprenyl synthetase family protein n=2 Tax=Actinomadura harenae TaxID=2483351 RepID=A0A3M2MHB5_9ACTN|nr:polyprenyl synthetase family protein [Actinomadura harenae]